METTTKRKALIAAGVAAVAVGVTATWLVLANHPQGSAPLQDCLPNFSATIVSCDDPSAVAVVVTVLPETGDAAHARCAEIVGEANALEMGAPGGGMYCTRPLHPVGG
jgi:hypothetical protein